MDAQHPWKKPAMVIHLCNPRAKRQSQEDPAGLLDSQASILAYLSSVRAHVSESKVKNDKRQTADNDL